MNTLEDILASTRVELARRRREVPLATLPTPTDRPPHAFRDALARPGISVIAEHKRRSPSAGAIRPESNVAEIARAYEEGGAAAISVLTEGPHFNGALEDLEEAAQACSLPLLRKDFILDPYQLAEAAAVGASAVLLIVAALDIATLRALSSAADELSLDVLVEVHNAAELELAASIGAELIGVNNRDLRDFSVDPERTFALLEAMPPGAIVVSESGISSSEDLVRLSAAGVDGVLIGERLMRAADPAQALRDLLEDVTRAI
jgi:indole-3-glycerol phosphate synthase